MSRFVTYTYLRIKAVMKIYPAMCIMTLFLCLSLGGMLYLQSERTEDLSGGDEDARISIGVVGTATSGYLDTTGPSTGHIHSTIRDADHSIFISKNTRGILCI